MKAVVLKVKGKHAAVLTADGAFRSIRNRNYTKGQKLEISEVRLNRTLISMASAAAAVFLLMGGITANAYACSTVTLDVNPSLKYELNFFDQVLDFEAYNEDGQEIVDKLSTELKGKKIDDAIGITLDELENEHYIEEETPVVVTLNSRFKGDRRLEKRAEQGMRDWNEKHAEDGSKKSISGETVIVTDDLSKKALEKNQSPGRIYMDEHYPMQEKAPLPEPSDPDQVMDHVPQPDEKSSSPDSGMDPQGDLSSPPGDGMDPPDKNNSQPNGDMTQPNGGSPSPDGNAPQNEGSQPPGGGMNPPDKNSSQPNGDMTQPNGGSPSPDGNAPQNEGSQPPGGGMDPPDDSHPQPNGDMTQPNEGMPSPGGGTPPSEGSQPPDGGMSPPDENHPQQNGDAPQPNEGMPSPGGGAPPN
ncbi:MAG: hypothetical protein K6F35_08345 [Lachnospiraceae bacterium]|nr:hypothetical protein [Lachnospiraceae bacterium]